MLDAFKLSLGFIVTDDNLIHSKLYPSEDTLSWPWPSTKPLLAIILDAYLPALRGRGRLHRW